MYIYKLIDPRDNAIRYIGKAIDPEVRLARHIGGRNSLTHGPNLAKNEWIKELCNVGLRPVMVILAQTTTIEANVEEREQIAAHASNGCKLFNIIT